MPRTQRGQYCCHDVDRDSRGVVFIDAQRVDADVIIDGPTISALAPRGADRHAQVIDATGCSVLPASWIFRSTVAVGVDLSTQRHRIGEVAEFLVQCGVTSFMPTVISSSVADTASAVAALHEWSQTIHTGARSLGVHLEGPFLNPVRAGAHPLHHLRHPSLAEATAWSPDSGVAMVTVSPELPQALGLIVRLVANGVVVAPDTLPPTAQS